MTQESTSDLTLDLVVNEILKSTVDVRPTGASSSEKQAVCEKNFASQFIPNLYNVIPDVVYRPDIKVAFDFTSTFVVNTVFEENYGLKTIQGKRLVDSDTLSRAAINLADYVQYYHEYILSYSIGDEQKQYDTKSEEGIYGLSVHFRSKGQVSEQDASLFINRVINYFLTSITINRVKNDISTCSMSFRDTAQFDLFGKATRLFFEQGFPLISQLFVPMLPFAVWAKGRLYPDYMFPVFTGYINRVTPSNDQGYTALKIDGKDCLELARILYENVNPSLTGISDPSHQALNFYSKVFYGIDHIEIVRSIFVGGAIEFDKETGQRVMSIQSLESDTANALPKMYPIGTFKPADEDPGHTTPAVVLDSKGIKRDDFDIDVILSWLKREKYICSWGYNMTPYRPFGNQSFDTYTSQFSNRLELLKGVAGIVYYEFYTDGAGNVHYHPMRMGNDFLLYDSFYPKDVQLPTTEKKAAHVSIVQTHSYPFPYAQVVSNHDLTGVNKSYNVEEMTTFLILDGLPAHEAISEGRSIDLVGNYRDDVNLARFGYRMKRMNCPLLNVDDDVKDTDGKNKSVFQAMAKAFLEYSNGQLYTTTISMLFRPELELAAPIYVVEDSEVFYINSITHTIDIGSSATTVASCSFGRHENEAEVDLISYMLNTELLVKSKALEIRSVGSVNNLKRNLDFVIPFTSHAEYREKLYKDLEKRYDRMSEASITGQELA